MIENIDYAVVARNEDILELRLSERYLDKNFISNTDLVDITGVFEYELDYVIDENLGAAIGIHIEEVKLNNILTKVGNNNTKINKGEKIRKSKSKLKALEEENVKLKMELTNLKNKPSHNDYLDDQKRIEMLNDENIKLKECNENYMILQKKYDLLKRENMLLKLHDEYIISDSYNNVLLEYEVDVRIIEKIITDNCSKKNSMMIEIDTLNNYLFNSVLCDEDKTLLQQLLPIFKIDTDQKAKFHELQYAINLVNSGKNILDYLIIEDNVIKLSKEKKINNLNNLVKSAEIKQIYNNVLKGSQ